MSCATAEAGLEADLEATAAHFFGEVVGGVSRGAVFDEGVGGVWMLMMVDRDGIDEADDRGGVSVLLIMDSENVDEAGSVGEADLIG